MLSCKIPSSCEQEDISKGFRYDPVTGHITRKGDKSIADDRIVSRRNRTGYIVVPRKNKFYSAHRVAWFLYYGEWPETLIDHVNGIRDDNRIVNLRLATVSQNTINSKISSRNKSGYKGVFRSQRKGFWSSRIFHNGKLHVLGEFATVEEAAKAYSVKAEELHGAFINLNSKVA